MIDSNISKINIDGSLSFALLDNMREGAAIMERDSHKMIYCNKAYLHFFGIQSLEDIDINLICRLRKNKCPSLDIQYQEAVIEKKGVFTELVEYTSVNGTPFFGEVKKRLYVQNGVTYYLIILAAVEKSFFEISSLGILMVNNKGEIVSANPYLLNQFGYSKTEVIGKQVELLIPSRYHENHKKKKREFLHDTSNRSMGTGRDLFAIKKDGTEFPVEVSLAHYPSDGDQYVLAYVLDLSVRKRNETELKEMNDMLESTVKSRTVDLSSALRKLESSKKELQNTIAFQKALLNNARAIIVSVDTKGIIQTFNLEAERNLGYKAAELIGKHTPQIYNDPILTPEKTRELSQEFQKTIPESMELFYANACLSLPNENEWVYVRKDGTKFPVLLNISAMRNENGLVIGFVGVALDISKTKSIEDELHRALDKEKELSGLKSRFVSMASHEFRTPLSTVLSSAYLIEKYTNAEDQAKRSVHLQRVVSSVNMLTDILNDFLSVGKIEEGKIQVRPSSFDIRQHVLSIMDEVKNNLKKQQQLFYNHYGATDVLLDSSLLKHIILNLISNASKFSSEGSPIEIYSNCNGQYITLSVKDHGIGISREDQQHLMERFFRGGNASNIQGTGLGLHIVSKYVELLDGTIACKSELEKGTVITMKFNLKTT